MPTLPRTYSLQELAAILQTTPLELQFLITQLVDPGAHLDLEEMEFISSDLLLLRILLQHAVTRISHRLN